MENKTIYEQVRSVPKEAQKKITGGRLNGMTDIKPMWRIEKLTEVFGPCGFGWKAPIKNKEIIEGANGEKIAIVDIDLYVKVDNEWSEPIEGTGGSSFIAKEKAGLYTSDECFKMAYTDAISVACKSLGFGADIYWGDSKYDTSKKIETKEDAEKYVVTFGKHEGKTIKQILEEDNWYAMNYLMNKANDENIKVAISMLTGKQILTEAEQQEAFELMVKMNTLVLETDTDYEELLKYFGVTSNSEMNIPQLREAVAILEKKKDKNLDSNGWMYEQE